MKPYEVLGVRNRTLIESYGLLDSYRQPIAGSDCMIEKSLEIGHGFAVCTCGNMEDRRRLRVLMEKEIREGKYTQAFFDAIDKTYKDVVRDIKTFWREDFSKISGENLIPYLDRALRINVATIHPMVVGIYASDLQDLFESELRSALGAPSQEEMLDYTALLLTPTRLTQVQKEDQALFVFQSQFVHEYPNLTREEFDRFIGSDSSKKMLEELELKYGFFHMEYIGEPKRASDYKQLFWSRIEDMKQGGESWKNQLSPNERLENTIQRQQEFFTKNPAPLLKSLSFAMQEWLIVLDYSKADLVEGIYYARPLYEEIGKRLGLDWIYARYLLPEEMRETLRKKVTIDTSLVESRHDFYAMLLDNNTITAYFGEEGKQLVDSLLEIEDAPANVREFKGLTAYPGKIRGIACVVTGAQDRDKFEKGRIMVTRDTTTELTSIIKMASAIIADQGSLLSHTAIVSREFKIPCLVQTKFGTKVVKDGDEIEVDAGNGIVRILS